MGRSQELLPTVAGLARTQSVLRTPIVAVDIPLALLAKSFAADWVLRAVEIRKTNCFGCSIQDYSDRKQHDRFCSGTFTLKNADVAPLVYALYSQFITATDHHHVSRLLKKFMIQLNVPLPENELLFSRSHRENLARESHDFQDLVLTYLLTQHPQILVPVCSTIAKEKQSTPGESVEVIRPLSSPTCKERSFYVD